MGNTFQRKSGVPEPTVESQIQERKEYADNLRAQLSYKCNHDKNEEACHALGEFFMAFDRDRSLALEVLKENCWDRSFGKSCMMLGQIQLSFEGEQVRDVPNALKSFKRACEFNIGGGCTMSGMVHGMGIDGVVPVDMQVAARHFEKGCELDDKVGCFQGAMVARYAPTPAMVQDFQKALKMFTQACESGSLLSCRETAMMYERGLGVPTNPEKANEYHQKSMVEFRNPMEALD